MSIADINYVSKKVKEGRELGQILIEENKNKLDKMVNENTDENREIYRDARDKFERHTYRSLLYLDTEKMLNNGKNISEIINVFKVRVNTEKMRLEQFNNLYHDEEPMMVGAPLANKQLEVEELVKFMEEEIYIV